MNPLDPLFSGQSEMARRMREVDWASTPLGPVESWPQSLKTSVRIMLTSRQPMFVWWGDDLINLYNDAYKSIVGGKHPQALGQPASVVWREIWDKVGPRAESTMRKNEGTYDEALLLIMERNGYPEETYYTFSYSPVPNDQGGTGGIFCANTDDTQRIVGERQLALLRELAAKTVDARTIEEVCSLSAKCLETNPYDLPFAMMYLVDPERQQVTLAGTSGIAAGSPASPHTSSLQGEAVWPFATAFNTRRAVHVPDLGEKFENLPTGVWHIPPEQAVVLPITLSGQAGRDAIMVVGLNPFRLFDDHYRGFLELTATQIAASMTSAQAYESERKRAESLAELDRAKTAFFSNVSHEFRTPLTLMLSPLEETLAAGGELQPKHRRQLDMAHRNALRLLKLVNTLLDFSRIEAGRLTAIYEPTDLAAYTTELASVFRSAIEKVGLRFLIECSPVTEAIYIDRDMWEKVILNLLSNAFKFTLAGEIDVSLKEYSAFVELQVRDTGVGIPAEELLHVFERFHRVRTTEGRTHEGTGIGLALVQELVKLHGGNISVQSAPGHGSTFVIMLPKGKAHLPQDRISGALPHKSASNGARLYLEEALRWLPEDIAEVDALDAETESSQFLVEAADPSHGARILLADDNADMRAYIRRLLERRYTVEAVVDGEAALVAARAHPPDLVLSDVMMPRLDGFDLLAEMRNDPNLKTIPVILLSARAGEESRVEGLEAGADDYLTKPFSARELLARVRANLEMARVRRAFAAEIDAERSLLKYIFDKAPAFVAVLRGREHVIESFNPAYRQLVGSRELAGKTIREALPEVVSQGFLELLDEVYRTGEPYSGRGVPILLQRHPGIAPDRVFLDFVYQPILAGDGSVSGIFVHGVDVTPQKESEKERERLLAQEQDARREAERANRLKDEFLATVSHELRTPLTAILGWAHMLRTKRIDSGRYASALESMERNARNQKQLIDDLLDVSRIVTGKLRLDVQPLDPVLPIEAAIDSVTPAAEAKKVRIEKVIDAGLSVISGDADRLQQIVWNLLSNAVKFTPVEGLVQIRLQRVNSHIEIRVTDSGIGIKLEFLPFVFDRFRQADATATRAYGGLGLGLAIVRHLVELHGGEVTAHSEGQGKGATFAVKLPLVAAYESGASEERVNPRVDESLPQIDALERLDGLKALVVDDEQDTCELLKTMLEKSGAEVTIAKSADEGLTALARSQFDVILSDIGMPETDGYQFMLNVRQLPTERGGRTPAVALTAYARTEDRLKALRAGYQMHVPKPIEYAELVTVMVSLGGRQ